MLSKSLKRSQTADTMTWLVATIIIIVILGAFVFFAGALSEAGGITDTVVSFFSGDAGGYGSVNWIKEKNDIAFELDAKNKVYIEGWLNG